MNINTDVCGFFLTKASQRLCEHCITSSKCSTKIKYNTGGFDHMTNQELCNKLKSYLSSLWRRRRGRWQITEVPAQR